jgi:hypothetical protein
VQVQRNAARCSVCSCPLWNTIASRPVALTAGFGPFNRYYVRYTKPEHAYSCMSARVQHVRGQNYNMTSTFLLHTEWKMHIFSIFPLFICQKLCLYGLVYFSHIFTSKSCGNVSGFSVHSILSNPLKYSLECSSRSYSSIGTAHAWWPIGRANSVTA